VGWRVGVCLVGFFGVRALLTFYSTRVISYFLSLRSLWLFEIFQYQTTSAFGLADCADTTANMQCIANAEPQKQPHSTPALMMSVETTPLSNYLKIHNIYLRKTPQPTSNQTQMQKQKQTILPSPPKEDE
jgi:hypothetical protein